jgi:hypothetical protein
MAEIKNCGSCGSTKMSPDIPMPDRAGAYGDVDGQAYVKLQGRPEGWIRKDTAFSDLFMTICGECGHVEIRASNYRELYGKYLSSIGRDREAEIVADEFDCLVCGQVIAGGSSCCPRCGWSWKLHRTES